MLLAGVVLKWWVLSLIPKPGWPFTLIRETEVVSLHSKTTGQIAVHHNFSFRGCVSSVLDCAVCCTVIVLSIFCNGIQVFHCVPHSSLWTCSSIWYYNVKHLLFYSRWLCWCHFKRVQIAAMNIMRVYIKIQCGSITHIHSFFFFYPFHKAWWEHCHSMCL